MRREWPWLGLAAVVLVAGCLLHTFCGDSMVGRNPLYRGAHAWGSDDAFITYRYARNLFVGHGLVWNPGYAVEGYTSLLYTLAMAALYFVTDDAGIYAWSVGVNVAFALASMFVFARIAREREGAEAVVPAALLFALLPSLWIWVASGLETSFVLLLQLVLWLGVERALRDERRARWLLLPATVALALARADGFVFVAIVVGYLVLQRRVRLGLITLGLCALALGLHVLFRLDRYGFPWPNTYYVKVAGEPLQRAFEGVKRLALITQRFFPGLGFALGVVALGWLGALSRLHRPWLDWARALPFHRLMAPVLLAYWIWIGGDYFGDRFLLPVYAAAALDVLAFARAAQGSLRRLALGLVSCAQLGAVVWSPMFTYRTDKYDYWLELAPYLAARHQDPVLAIDAAGKVPFVTGWRTIDMLGLNDVHIGHKKVDTFETPGHDKSDADYVLARRPDLVAAWIHRDGNMYWGLSREKYEAAGYALKYVMNAAMASASDNVIDVDGTDAEELARLFDLGYVYGVLERKLR